MLIRIEKNSYPPVILSLSKDGVLLQDNLQYFSSVILSSSKDEDLLQDNIRRLPPHFDRACPELAEGLSVT